MYNSRPVNEALGTDPLHPGVPLGAFLTTVAEFEIEYHQFLDAEGKLREPAPALAHDSAELIEYIPNVGRITDAIRATLAA